MTDSLRTGEGPADTTVSGSADEAPILPPEPIRGFFGPNRQLAIPQVAISYVQDDRRLDRGTLPSLVDPRSPWDGGAAANMDAAARANAQRAVLNGLTVLLLVTTIAVVLWAGMPIIIRGISPGVAEAASRGIARVMRSKGYAVGPPEQTTSHDSAFGVEKQGSGHQNILRHLGVASKDLVLRQAADADAAEIGKLERGSVVLIIKESGSWVQVVSRESQDVIAGWTERKSVTLP